MRSTAVVWTLALCALCPAAARAQKARPAAAVAPTAPADTISLAVGETYTLPARGVRNWTEGVPGIVEVKVVSDGSQFLVAGRKQGSTTLLFIRDDGSQQTIEVNVFARPPGVVTRELEQLLEGLPSVRVRQVGPREVIDGTVQDDVEKARVEHIASLYPGQVDSLVTVRRSEAALAARRYLVRIDFYFVQLDRSTGYTVGMGWPSVFGGTNALASTFNIDLLVPRVTQGTLAVTQPLPELDLVESKGWGKVLKHATVVANSGEQAKFRSGGVQNYIVNTGLTVGLQTIPFGVEVDVVPRFDPARREVALKIASTVSDLTAPGAGTQIPSRNESNLETSVDVKLGQSLVLSGVRLRRQTHDVTGLPILGQIPVLGLLFASHNDATEDTEGAIYIVPSVIESVAESSLDLIQTAVRTFDDYGGHVDQMRLSAPKRGVSP